jgi:hypothetical protein
LLISREYTLEDFDFVQKRTAGACYRHAFESGDHCLRLLEERCKGWGLAETNAVTKSLQLFTLSKELAIMSNGVVRDRAFKQIAYSTGMATDWTWTCSMEDITEATICANGDPLANGTCGCRGGRGCKVVSRCEGLGDRGELRSSGGWCSIEEDIVSAAPCVSKVLGEEGRIALGDLRLAGDGSLRSVWSIGGDAQLELGLLTVGGVDSANSVWRECSQVGGGCLVVSCPI